MAQDQYFCRHCCVEFHGAPGSWRVFVVDEEGNLIEAGRDLGALRPAPVPPAEATAAPAAAVV